jgi:hypothetical protein
LRSDVTRTCTHAPSRTCIQSLTLSSSSSLSLPLLRSFSLPPLSPLSLFFPPHLPCTHGKMHKITRPRPGCKVHSVLQLLFRGKFVVGGLSAVLMVVCQLKAQSLSTARAPLFAQVHLAVGAQIFRAFFSSRLSPISRKEVPFSVLVCARERERERAGGWRGDEGRRMRKAPGREKERCVWLRQGTRGGKSAGPLISSLCFAHISRSFTAAELQGEAPASVLQRA